MVQKNVSNDATSLNSCWAEIAELTTVNVARVVNLFLLSKQIPQFVRPLQYDWSVDGFRVVTRPCFAQEQAGDGITAIDVIIEPYERPKVTPPPTVDILAELTAQKTQKEHVIAETEKLRAETEDKKKPLEVKIAAREKEIAKEENDDRKGELESDNESDKAELQRLEDAITQMNQDIDNERGMLATIDKNIGEEQKKVKEAQRDQAPEQVSPDFPLRYKIDFA